MTLLKPVARLLARIVALLLLIALAVAGLAIAVFSIQDGTNELSPANLAEIAGFAGLRDSVADLLGAVEADGPLALLSALAGLGTIALGVILLIGALAAPTERTFEGDDSADGRIAARPRPLAKAAGMLAEQVRGVTRAKASARPSRGGGSISVRAIHGRSTSGDELSQRVEAELAPLRDGFGLRTRVRPVSGDKGSRVE